MVVVGVAVGFETLVLLNPVEGDQENVVPPVTLSAELLPEQIAAGLAVATGLGTEFTVMVTDELEVQPFTSVANTVYVVVAVGVAVGDWQVLQLNPDAGAQEKVVPPEAVMPVELPVQMVLLVADAVTLKLFTVTTTVSELEQPFAPVTKAVYEVVAVGEALVLAQKEQLRLEAGTHEYVTPPEALSVALALLQTL